MCDTLSYLIIQGFCDDFNSVLRKIWLFYANTFGTFALSRVVVKVKKRSFQPALAVGKVKPRGKLGFELIDDNFGLVVKLADGTEKTLTSGEISVRLS